MIDGNYTHPKTVGLVRRWGVGTAAVVFLGVIGASAQEARSVLSDLDTRAVIDRTTRPEVLKRKVMERPQVRPRFPVRPDASTLARKSAGIHYMPSKWCVWYTPTPNSDMGLCPARLGAHVGDKCRCGNHAGVVEDPDKPPSGR